MHKLPEYDVVIIGAGIGGLVCGCLLAKKKIKTLILEQDYHVGGYCTSFSRKGYHFDSAIHYLGGIKHGILHDVISELDLDMMSFNQFDPTDKIVINDDSTYYIRSEASETINGLIKSFPNEKAGIKKLFDFLSQTEILKLYFAVRKLTFKQVLDRFVSNARFQLILDCLLYGNMGLPIEKISAFAAIGFIKQFLLDPGYYPSGGMQNFSNNIAKQFEHYGGEIILNSKVIRILTNDKSASGVITHDGKKFFSRFVVSNSDALLTFKNLVRSKTKELETAERLKPSVPIFGVYLGMKNVFRDKYKQTANIWQVNSSGCNANYLKRSHDASHCKLPILMSFFPSSHDTQTKHNTVQIFTVTSYESETFWESNREKFAAAMVNSAGKTIPELSKNIVFQLNATPYTFQRYTANSYGAAYGWASIPSQIDPTVFPQRTSINNLYLAGHWTTIGGGQGGVAPSALSGFRAARSILNKFK